MHSRVTGEYITKSGSQSPYQASDPRYLLWVHCAFTDSFLKTHLAFNPGFKDGDQYVREWAKSAEGLGLTEAPHSVADLEATMEKFANEELTPSIHTEQVVRFILQPPLGKPSLLLYRFLAKSAVYTLTPKQREILGLKQVSKGWVIATSFILAVLSWTLGGESPSQEVARERIARISQG
jgi:uncharacterized protein (DUF2236 family)